MSIILFLMNHQSYNINRDSKFNAKFLRVVLTHFSNCQFQSFSYSHWYRSNIVEHHVIFILKYQLCQSRSTIWVENWRKGERSLTNSDKKAPFFNNLCRTSECNYSRETISLSNMSLQSELWLSYSDRSFYPEFYLKD